jgi:23S rRNA pseudouridine2605 synthase
MSRRPAPRDVKPGKQGASEAQSRPERLQKIMAAAGLGSRRALEQRIKNGEVRINSHTAGIGQSVAAGDEVAFDGREWRVVTQQVKHRNIVYNKPTGEVTTRSDPQGRRTVFDRLPRLHGARWIAVGRLDINTSGLLLLTTDGELANAMMHPSNRVDREYACRIFGEVDDAVLARLKEGVELDDGPAQFSDIVDSGGEGDNHWYHVTILEGRNREVRRLWASQGVTVSRLKRVRYGAVFLPKRLRMGDWSELTPGDHRILREDVGLAPLPVELALQPTRGHRESDLKTRRTKKAPRKKAGRRTPAPRKKTNRRKAAPRKRS